MCFNKSTEIQKTVDYARVAFATIGLHEEILLTLAVPSDWLPPTQRAACYVLLEYITRDCCIVRNLPTRRKLLDALTIQQMKERSPIVKAQLRAAIETLASPPPIRQQSRALPVPSAN